MDKVELRSVQLSLSLSPAHSYCSNMQSIFDWFGTMKQYDPIHIILSWVVYNWIIPKQSSKTSESTLKKPSILRVTAAIGLSEMVYYRICGMGAQTWLTWLDLPGNSLWISTKNKKNWVVVSNNISQLGWWHSQYMGTLKSCSKPPTRKKTHGTSPRPRQGARVHNVQDSHPRPGARSTWTKRTRKMSWIMVPSMETSWGFNGI